MYRVARSENALSRTFECGNPAAENRPAKIMVARAAVAYLFPDEPKPSRFARPIHTFIMYSVRRVKMITLIRPCVDVSSVLPRHRPRPRRFRKPVVYESVGPALPYRGLLLLLPRLLHSCPPHCAPRIVRPLLPSTGIFPSRRRHFETVGEILKNESRVNTECGKNAEKSIETASEFDGNVLFPT